MLRSFAITTMLIPFLFFGGSEESILKDARIDVRVAQYHLATIRLERLLKEHPKSHNRPEILTLIVKSYALSKRGEEALPHLRALVREFPREAATLDPKILELLPPSERPEKIVPVIAASPAPPETSKVVVAAAPPDVKQQLAGGSAVVVAATPPPPEPAPAAIKAQEPLADNGKAAPAPAVAPAPIVVPAPAVVVAAAPAPEEPTAPAVAPKDTAVAESTPAVKVEPAAPTQTASPAPPNTAVLAAETATVKQNAPDVADAPAKFELVPPSPDLAKSNLSFGMYNLASERLERLLKEYPKSKYREETLNLLVSAYVLSHQEEKALPFLRTLVQEYPGAVATLDEKTLKLLTAPSPAKPAEPTPEVAAADVPEPANGPAAETPPERQATADSPLPAPLEAGTPKPDAPAPVAAQAAVAPVPEQLISAEQTPAVKPGEPLKDLSSAEPAPAAPKEKLAAVAPEVSAAPVTSETAAPPAGPAPSQQLGDAQSAAPPTVKGPFTLFVGETLYRHTLAQKLKQLRTAGLRPQVRKNARTIQMYRLVAERFPTSREAHKSLRQLARLCKGAFVFKEGNAFYTAAGSFSMKNLAEQEQKRLAEKGLTIKLVPVNAVVPSWKITAGKFPDRKKAEETRKKVLKIASETAILRI